MFAKTLLAGLALAIAAPCPARTSDATPRFKVSQTMRLFHPDISRNWRGARTQALRTTIWYPVDPALPERPHDIGPPGTAYFRGAPLVANAPLSPLRRTYPLIVLSHGTGGTADTLDWIAAPLAASGYIVAAVDHPGNNALEPLTWDGFVLGWERATDLSEVLDGMLADPAWAEHIDRDRIGALGFSLGGYTVLELAGARTNLAALMAFCRSPDADAVCHPPEMDRVTDGKPVSVSASEERQASLARAGSSYRDKRIKAAFVIAPAMGQAFDARSFTEANIPVAIIAGDADVNVPPATNARHIASLLRAAAISVLPGAGHYTFLPVCAQAMAATSPQLCNDKPGIDRATIHLKVVGMARAFFNQVLRLR